MSTSKRPSAVRKSKTSTNPDRSKAPLSRCPACHSDRVRPIVYGLPGEELIQEASRERVVLGGCTIIEGDPRLDCLDCDHRWS